VVALGLGCRSHADAQGSFEHAQQTLRHGELIRAQEEAEQGYQLFHITRPEWARRFRDLEVEALLLRGLYSQGLTLLEADPKLPDTNGAIIEVLVLKGIAHARLHHFADAERNIRHAEAACHTSPEATCGGVLRARGILAVQQGQPDKARQFFEQTLDFARFHGDQFLEATALLNLGVGALQEQHYDEAIDRTDAAYRIAAALDAGTIATKALGNLGWAYYNLGDPEKSLELSLGAEKRAIEVGDVIDQLSWLTNSGYVYQQKQDISRAKQSYVKALELAREIDGREDIYNALRALALVSVQSGDLDHARTYSDEAIAIAQEDKNRLDELYPLLVKGLIADRANDVASAERIFREVERDEKSNASLTWRAEHGLARLYEGENRLDLADGEYRAALTTFEGARLSLKRNDSKLPFSTNAARIYDDYVHFLVAQGKTEDALRWADYSRARTLAEGLGLLPKGALDRDQAAPPVLNPREISRRAQGALLFYWLGEKQSYLWAITPSKTVLFPLPPGAEIESLVQRYRNSLAGPQDVLASSEDGRALYRTLIAPAKAVLGTNAKVFIIPDGSLNSLNFETLIVADPKPHYWIEDADVVNASSLRVLAASLTRGHVGERKHPRRLLLIGDSIAPSKEYPELPRAGDQMASVAGHFPAMRQIYQRDQANPAAYLTSNPEKFSHIHFVAHGTASRLSPLDSAIVLSKGAAETDSFKLYARDIVQHPLHADLVTISACYGAGSRAYSGEGLVGLAWAFLRAGAHNVIASLWEVTDASTEQLMDRFYDELNKGASPDAALRAAKLSLLHGSAFHNPFYWAPFQLYTGS
jgi:CHAT domain-containing protein/tetratricopeptide (TPR) repeat protein